MNIYLTSGSDYNEDIGSAKRNGFTENLRFSDLQFYHTNHPQSTTQDNWKLVEYRLYEDAQEDGPQTLLFLVEGHGIKGCFSTTCEEFEDAAAIDFCMSLPTY